MKFRAVLVTIVSTVASFMAMATTGMSEDGYTLTVEAGEVYSLTSDTIVRRLEVGSGSTLDLAGFNLTVGDGTSGAFWPLSTADSTAMITNSAEGNPVDMSFVLTQGIGSGEFRKVKFSGNLRLVVNAYFSAVNFLEDMENTHTGGTVLDNLRGSSDPRVKRATDLGSTTVTFKNGAKLRHVGSAVTWPWTELNSTGSNVTNYFYEEFASTFPSALRVNVDADNTFAIADLRNGGTFGAADYSGVLGSLWIRGNNSGNISFYPEIANGVLLLSGKEIRHGGTGGSENVWVLGGVGSPCTVTGPDENAKFRRVGTSGGKVTVEVGSANRDTTWYGQFVYDNNSSKDWNIKKVGTGIWTIGGVNYYRGTTEIAGGAIRVLKSGEIGDSGTAPAVNFTGGSFIFADVLDHDPSARFRANSDVVAGIGVDGGVEVTPASLAGLLGGMKKISGGTLIVNAGNRPSGTLEVAEGTLVLDNIGWSDDVVVDDGATLVASNGVEFGSLSVAGRIAVDVSDWTDLSDSKELFTVATASEGLEDRVVLLNAPAGYTFPVSVDAGVVVATAVPDGIVWTNGGGDNLWSNGDNWRGGSVPATTDNVIFDGETSVTVSGNNAIVSNLYVNGTMTLSYSGEKGSGYRGLHVKGVSGKGAIVLDNGRISTVSGSALECALPITVVSSDASATNWITGLSAFWTQKGPITGSGIVNFRGWSGTAGVKIAGDNSAFTGTGIIDADASNQTQFVSPGSASASADWVYTGTKTTNRVLFNPEATDTIEFGSLNQTAFYACSFRVNLSRSSSVVTVKVGANGKDSVIMGGFGDPDNNNERPNSYSKIVKVGDGNLKLYAPWHRCGTEINGGTVEVIGPDAISGKFGRSSISPITFGGGTLKYGYDSTTRDANGYVTTDWSSQIVGSTAAIKVETSGADVTWATALSDSNEMHEIVKTGKGNLVLTQAPAWGTTKVTVAFRSKGSVLLPIGAPYELGSDGNHRTRVAAVTIDGVDYNQFTNPNSFVIIFR